MPTVYFYPVKNWDDEHVVDAVALHRAYTGLVDASTGQVLNTQAITTCMKPNDILEKAYLGNLTSNDVGGEITSIEHVSSVKGRKQVDKVVTTRRSLEFTMGFDEVNESNFQKYFGADNVAYPNKITAVAKTSCKAPFGDGGDFIEGAVEVLTNNLSYLEDDLSSLEYLATEILTEQNFSFEQVDVSSTYYSPTGIFYFTVPDYQREENVSENLANYRGKILCAIMQYDHTVGEMKVKPWLDNMNGTGYSYADTTIHSNIKQLKMNGTDVGVPTHTIIQDRSIVDSTRLGQPWNFNSSSVVTHTITNNLIPRVANQSIRVTISGMHWNGTAWEEKTEVLADYGQENTNVNNMTKLRTSTADDQYFTNPANTYINYETGLLNIEAATQFVTDSTTEGGSAYTEQTLTVNIEYYSTGSTTNIYNGFSWVKDNASFATMRVNKGQAELEGPALIIFEQNIGVSYIYMSPKATLRPDGQIDFNKDDWNAGSFILTAIKKDDAYIPYLPTRISIPFGLLNTYRYTEA